MNAQELFIKNKTNCGSLPVDTYKSSQIYFCEKCRLVYSNKERADQCCQNHVCKCGKTCEQKYYLSCDECSRKKKIEQEKEKFNKAEKIDIKDYKGYILDDESAHDDWGQYFDNYFENHDLACPECEEETEVKDCPDIKGYSYLKCKCCNWKSQCYEIIDEIYYLFAPEYIWATDFEPVTLDIGNILENATQDHHESVHDYMKGTEELKIAIDKWNDLNKNCGSYNESNTLALINIKSFVQKLYA